MEHFSFNFDLISLVIGLVVGFFVKPLWAKARGAMPGS